MIYFYSQAVQFLPFSVTCWSDFSDAVLPSLSPISQCSMTRQALLNYMFTTNIYAFCVIFIICQWSPSWCHRKTIQLAVNNSQTFTSSSFQLLKVIEYLQTA